MAETQQKRLREESHDSESLGFDDSNSNSKRQKPYTNILSLLEEEEEEEEEQPSQDLSAIYTTLQQELSSSTTSKSAAFDFDYTSFEAAEQEETPHQQPTAAPSTSDEDEGVKSVMRHLLEASDDELGIPNTEDNYNVEISSDENFPFAFADDGLWEFDDVAANYYTRLQTELFM
ncbi:hypothetical protein Sango_1084700 [Sesamum angolense]|uniref:Uncharacterized protein n=1 Tax=Sesamum angolense TaxID=2727404 RepID=A0AAE2BVX6_9LAMI|nr:hypothetical protein Sango_1084700 [Sesamum angolense]